MTNQEAEPAILAVALTESRPDLLAVALQDATRENLKVFLSSKLFFDFLLSFNPPPFQVALTSA